uniref:Uncharacterized protein n=1 Tax=Meloidogyne incognita TaxID=6306 RepID=A0A914LI78_MELIC
MCIVRYWLERLFRCGYERAEFENIIFNPVLIKLLFENEVMELNTKQTTLHYPIAKFESEAMKFVKDHLKIFEKFTFEFTLYDEDSDFDGIIMDILNDGARFPHVCITNYLGIYIVKLIKKKITTSTSCSSIVSKIEFKVDNSDTMWNYGYLHKEGVETKKFISSGQIRCFSSYEIVNIDNPNVVFSINYFWRDSEEYGGDIDFKIKRK